MAQDAEKMADAMMEVIKDMCRHFNGRTDVDDRLFYIDWVPDYSEEERFPKKGRRKKAETFDLFKVFWRKKQYIKTEGRTWTLKEEGRCCLLFCVS